MANTNRFSKANTVDKVDIYTAVTDRFVKGIEDVLEGRATTLPWRCPWKTAGGLGGFPRNGATGRPYNGVNVFVLWSGGRSDARWYTFKQVSERRDGSHVRKGEKSEKVVYFSRGVKQEADGTEKNWFALRHFSVFNFDQIEWAAGSKESKEVGAREKTLAGEQVEQPESSAEVEALRAKLLAHLGDKLSHGGDRACYSPSEDWVRMPVEARFESAGHYVATLAHETAHWSGHKSRLDRDLTGRFGSESYAAEELVAELASALMLAGAGVANPDLDANHRSYLANWAKLLKSDKNAIFTAAKLARESAQYLLPMVDEADEVEGETQEAAA
jgi:antirestriction protein ArdC